MNNTDFFRIKTFSLHPVSSKHSSKDTTIKKPRTVYSNDKSGIQCLLEGSYKSHCNTFVGYSRIPHKYDHFHEKTIPSTAMGTFLNSMSPRNTAKSEPQKDLLALSESLDVNQARLFFNKQQVFHNVFELNKFSPHRLKPRKRCTSKSPTKS